MKKSTMRIIAACAAIIALATVSCSKGNNNLDKVTLRLNWTPSAEHAFLYLGLDRGFYRDKGIDLQVQPSQGSTITAKLVGNKSSMFGLVSGDIVVMSVTKGVPIKAIATLYHESPAVIYSLKSKDITKPSDLVGKKLGVLINSTTFQQYQGMLKNAGVDRSKITEVPVSGTAQELLSGKVDAAMHYSNYLPIQIEEEGHQVNEIYMRDYGIKIYSQSLVTQDDYISQDPGLVQRFLDATLKSLAYSLQHPEEAIASLLAHNPELKKGLQTRMLQATNVLFTEGQVDSLGLGYMTESGWEQTQQTLLDVGLIQHKLDPHSYYDNNFFKKYAKAGKR